MDFSREDRVLLLLISDRCPLLNELRRLADLAGVQKRKRDHDPVLDVSTEALRQWRRGAIRFHRLRLLDLLVALCDRVYSWTPALKGRKDLQCQLEDCVDRLEQVKDLVQDQRQLLNAYGVGKLLRYESDTHVQYELDLAFYRERPLLASALFDMSDPHNARIAAECAAAVVGVYSLFLERPETNGSGAKAQWWFCPMRVRYLLRLGRQDDDPDIARRLPSNLAFIRVKLTVPTIQSGGPDWAYDGALVVNDFGMAAMLETRVSLRRDLLHLSLLPLTSYGNDEIAFGRYITIDQGSPPAVISGRALMHRPSSTRRGKMKWAEEATDYMASAKRLRAKDDEFQKLLRLSKHLRGTSWDAV